MISNISNEQEYKIALNEIEVFLQKGFENLSANETNELQRLSLLVEKYENVHYPISFIPKTVEELIRLKMIEKKLKQKNIAQILDITPTRLTEFLNGKRKVNIDLAKKLHNKLNIDANLILEII